MNMESLFDYNMLRKSKSEKDYVILVDEKDNEVGVMDKMEAHERGRLHRAFSVFISNSNELMYITKREKKKYHSGGLWSNTVCSHPKPGESCLDGAHRRLEEEVGFNCDLKETGTFVYKCKFSNGIIEHEYDHVFIGTYDGELKPNRNEIEEWDLVSLSDLKKDIENNPEYYTVWFKIALKTLSIFRQ